MTYQPPPEPPDELARLNAVQQYRTSTLLREAAFDDMAFLSTYICKTPIALVTLIDRTEQWFLSAKGVDYCSTSREAAFCTHALLGTELLIVPDLHADARFAQHPLVVGEPFIRFYAGVPLISPEGHALGTLCVLDTTPRDLEREQKKALQSLARMVMTQLELLRERYQNQAQG